MWQPTALTAAVLALATWIVFCLVAQPPRIEEALRREATRHLEAAGLHEVLPVLSGRDAALEGLVATPARMAEAERVVAGVAGVRAVANRLAVREAPESPSPSYLEIRIRSGGVALRGGVPSEARRLEVLDHARRVFGADRVEERLAVTAEAEDGAAVAAAAGVISALAGAGEGVKIRLRGDSLLLSGTVASAAALGRLEERVRAAVPEVRLFFSALRVGPDPGLPEGGERGD